MKEQYIKMRNNHIVDPNLLYIYAVQNGFTLSITEFLIGLQHCNINDIIYHLDCKFELTRLHDKNDNFIMIV
jgi:hypothetical protein